MPAGTWKLDGGGALMNQAIHSVDLLTWLMGPVVEVRAQMGLLAHQRIAVEDTALATVVFASGAMGVIEATTAAYLGYLPTAKGTGSCFRPTIFRKLRALEQKMDQAPDFTVLLSRPQGHRAPRQFQEVLMAIKKDTRPLIDGLEGRRSVEIIPAIYKDAETGRAVKLPLATDPTLKVRKTGMRGCY